jgi:hypothetical protein
MAVNMISSVPKLIPLITQESIILAYEEANIRKSSNLIISYGLLSHGGHLEKTHCLCPLSLVLKSFQSRPIGGRTIDFILLELKMAVRDKSPWSH